MSRWIRRVFITGLLLAGVLVLSASLASANPATESCFTSKINGARTSRGIPALRVHSELVVIARRHSRRMASQGTIFHNSNLANEAPDNWEALGENVGMGPSCGAIHNAFMNSASHRANILDRTFNFVGVGVVITSNGKIYVTEVFMKASQPAPSQPAPTNTSPKRTSPAPKRTAAAPKPAPTRAAAPAPAPASAPAPAPPPPKPSPSPPPGSLVGGQTKAYMDDLEGEPFPSADELDELRAERQRALALEEEQQRANAERRGLLARIAAFIAAVLSGSL